MIVLVTLRFVSDEKFIAVSLIFERSLGVFSLKDETRQSHLFVRFARLCFNCKHYDDSRLSVNSCSKL